jgi:hypothetical protein
MADFAEIQKGLALSQVPLEKEVAGACYARRPQNSLLIRQFAMLSARAVFWAQFRAAA